MRTIDQLFSRTAKTISQVGPMRSLRSNRKRFEKLRRRRLLVERLECRALLTAGMLDPTFGVGGKQSINFRGLAEDLAVASDGSVVVVGYDSNTDANGNSPNSLWSSILQPAGAGNDQLEGGCRT